MPRAHSIGARDVSRANQRQRSGDCGPDQVYPSERGVDLSGPTEVASGKAVSTSDDDHGSGGPVYHVDRDGRASRRRVQGSPFPRSARIPLRDAARWPTCPERCPASGRLPARSGTPSRSLACGRPEPRPVSQAECSRYTRREVPALPRSLCLARSVWRRGAAPYRVTGAPDGTAASRDHRTSTSGGPGAAQDGRPPSGGTPRASPRLSQPCRPAGFASRPGPAPDQEGPGRRPTPRAART